MVEQVYSLWSEIRPRHQLSRGWGSGDLQSPCFLVVNMTNDSSCSENAELQAHIRLLQSSLEVLQASNASLETEKSGLAEKVSSLTADLRKSQDEMGKLAARNEELSQESLVRVKSVERQQKLLATDHEVTNILGARSLHIIDVFDVSSQGEFGASSRRVSRSFYRSVKSELVNTPPVPGFDRSAQLLAGANPL